MQSEEHESQPQEERGGGDEREAGTQSGGRAQFGEWTGRSLAGGGKQASRVMDK